MGALAEGLDLVRAKLKLTLIRSAPGALLTALRPKLKKSLHGIDCYERKTFARQRRHLRTLHESSQKQVRVANGSPIGMPAELSSLSLIRRVVISRRRQYLSHA
jgi:hypothetical protein